MKSFLDLVKGAGCFLALAVLAGCFLPVLGKVGAGGSLFVDAVFCGIGLGAVTLYAIWQEAFGGGR